MPKVGKKHFAYTLEGIREAARYGRKKDRSVKTNPKKMKRMKRGKSR